MAAIRRAETKPETQLRSVLHARGLRFRKDYRLDLAGGRVRPDVVFTRWKVAVFVDGCFWHVCPVHGRQPTTNEWYWTPKLRRNMERDEQVNAALTEAGWTVLRFWEHDDVMECALLVQAAIEHTFERTASRARQRR